MNTEFDAAFLILLLMCGAALAVVIYNPVRIYEYPYFMTFGYAMFLVPQLTSLYLDSSLVVGGSSSLARYCFVGVCCLAACWVGYYAVPWRARVPLFRHPLDPSRCLWLAVLFTAVANAANILYRVTPYTLNERGEMSGVSVLIHFFTTLSFPSLALSFCLALQPNRLRLWAWLCSAAAAVGPLVNILMSGRRFSATFVVVIVGLSLYFTRGIRPPRWVILGTVFAGLVILPTVGKVRGKFADEGVDAYATYDPVSMFGERVGDATQPEALYGVAIVFNTDSFAAFDYGVGYWNQLIFRVVPGQVVGTDTKIGMQVRVDPRTRRALELPPGVSPGTVPTGVADSFLAFGYVGCLFFAALGAIFRVLWGGVKWGVANLGMKVFYIALVPEAIRTIVFQTVDLLPGIAEYFILWFFWLQIFGRRRINPSPEARLEP